MKIAVHGLGRMGMQIARKLAEGGHTVYAHNRSREPIDEAVSYGCVAAPSKDDVVEAFGSDAVVWVMLPADITDDEVAEWTSLLPEGSIIINGGNSDYRQTRKLNQVVLAAGKILVDVGVSGGVWGYKRGFPMMIGCDDQTTVHEILAPAFKTLALPEGGYQYFGVSGAGHYVKMVHNAIEYGMMQSLGEGYQLLKEGPYDGIDLAAAGRLWQRHSVIESWLNELTRQAVAENPEMTGVSGYVAESGEARWALDTARKYDIAMPSIEAAFNVRVASQKGDVSYATKVVAAQRNKFGDHNLNSEERA